MKSPIPARPQSTFREVRAWYESGHIVLDFFRETLFALDPERRPD